MNNPLKTLMKPRSVAIIGASPKPYSVGNIILENLRELGYLGKIYLVNPKYQFIDNIKCYPSITNIPDTVDVAIIAVPSKVVPKVLSECGVKGVPTVIIISSGFSEIGGEGEKLNNEIMNIAMEYGIRILGPNTTGILNLIDKFTSSFVKIPEHSKPGNVSMIVQTGIFTATMMRWIFTGEYFRLNKVIGLGNKIDIDDSLALQYLREDPTTKVIIMYMEGLKEPRKFFVEAKKTCVVKPVVLIKAGRTRLGMKASKSHTGSLAVPDEIFNGMCRQAGIIRVEDFKEAFDVVKMLSFYDGFFKGFRLGVASYSGAECVMAADSIEKYGFDLAELSIDTYERISSVAPPYWPKNHPIDLGPILETEDAAGGLITTVDALLSDSNVDILILILPVISEGEGEMIKLGAIEAKTLHSQIIQFKNRYRDKPILVILDGSKAGFEEAKRLFEHDSIPVYDCINKCVRALFYVRWWYEKFRAK